MIDASHWANAMRDTVRVWKPCLYQSQMAGKPFEQWAPCYDSDGWEDGKPRLCMNMDDIDPSYTLERAKSECVRRNTLQVHNARRAVEAAEARLAEAREHLAHVEAVFTDSVQ